jgi:glycosyltransferase involved in cell wall biosynthesis
MRIALVSSWYVPVPPVKYGGTEQVIHYLIRGLKELGHEPILIGTGDSKVDCEVIPIVDKATFFPMSQAEVPEFKRMEDEVWKPKTKQILIELAPRVDVIHSHGFDLKDFQQYPNLTTLHGKIDFENIDWFIERKDLLYASISKNQQGVLPDLQYIGVVYNGEDPTEFPIVTEPEDYICFLGRFDREKNPHLAIQLAIKTGNKIKVAGKYDHLGEGYFDQEIKPLLDHPLVEFLGELNFEEKVTLLSNARCNIHPTNFREPFGLTVLEAAYCGTPTLAVSRGSMPELIEDGRTGLLVEDISEGFARLNECFEMHRGYIANRARALFNYKAMAAQYVKAYTAAINIFAKKNEHQEFVQFLLKSNRELGMFDVD